MSADDIIRLAEDDVAGLLVHAMELAGLAESPDAWRGANLMAELALQTIHSARKVAIEDGADREQEQAFVLNSAMTFVAGCVRKSRAMLPPG